MEFLSSTKVNSTALGGHWEATQEAVLLLGLPSFGGSHLERCSFTYVASPICLRGNHVTTLPYQGPPKQTSRVYRLRR